MNIAGERRLQQALKRKQATSTSDEKSDSKVNVDERPATRQSVGTIHDVSSCIWCTHGYDERHPDRSEKLAIIENRTTWQKIVLSTPYLKDKAMQVRVEVLINSTRDPIAPKIAYHKTCFIKYVLRGLEEFEDGDNDKFDIAKVRKLFLDSLESSIFDDGEPRTLKQVLKDYQKFLLDHNILRTSLKTYDIKTMLIGRFGDRIGFQERYHKNESTLVYSKDDGGNFLEAALNCWGVSDEKLIETAAERLRQNVMSTSSENMMPWPPKVSELTKDVSSNTLLQSFALGLSGKNQMTKPSSEVTFLTELLESSITSKRTPMKTLFGVTLHGLTRSRELLDIASDLGVSVTYKDVQYRQPG